MKNIMMEKNENQILKIVLKRNVSDEKISYIIEKFFFL